MFILCVCVYVENTAMASSIKTICSPVCACVHVWKVYWINVYIDGRSKKDWLYLHTCVCVSIYMRVTVSMGLLFFKVQTWVLFRGLWDLATTCRVSVVGKRTSLASSFYVLSVMLSIVRRPRFSLVVECLILLNSSLFTHFWWTKVDQK